MKIVIIVTAMTAAGLFYTISNQMPLFKVIAIGLLPITCFSLMAFQIYVVGSKMPDGSRAYIIEDADARHMLGWLLGPIIVLSVFLEMYSVFSR